jgi:DNA-binding MarR family transcriptional regulator
MKCMCAKTRRTARRLTRFYEERLRAVNLTAAQFELLSELAGGPGRSQVELAADLGLDQTTLSRNLKTLIANGWVIAASSVEDRRRAVYSLTAAGRATWQVAMPHWQAAHDHLRKAMGGEWQATFALLERLSAALSA